MDAPAVTDEVIETAEAPASPDATSAPGGAGEEPAGTGQAPTASDRARDEKGRFAKQDQPTETSTGETRGALTEPVTPPVVQPPAPKGDPFTFRAEGQRIPLNGAFLTPDGALTVAPEQVPQVRQLFADAIAFRTTWRQKEADFKQQVEQAGAVEKARADKYNRAAILMWDRMTSPEWIRAAATDPRELEYLRRELDLELKQADLTIPKAEQPRQAAPQQDPQQLESQARDVLKGYVEELLERPQAKAVYDTQEKRQALEKRLQRRLAAYFVDQDGQLALHENRVDEDFEEELNERLAAKQEAEKARKAAEFNAKRNQPAPNVPPVVSTKAPPSQAPQNTRYDSREEWRRKNGIG